MSCLSNNLRFSYPDIWNKHSRSHLSFKRWLRSFYETLDGGSDFESRQEQRFLCYHLQTDRGNHSDVCRMRFGGKAAWAWIWQHSPPNTTRWQTTDTPSNLYTSTNGLTRTAGGGGKSHGKRGLWDYVRHEVMDRMPRGWGGGERGRLVECQKLSEPYVEYRSKLQG
jgi:hypothetical protein